ncbi:hypothetical protein [Pedobacter sp. Leaf132]|uniref:hypothetical protein n=1 Tax=Pedobacter sp. Leaf132 TaxID=2876557 RepID=UPI001E487A63|nr:hypothetical protein [Pedobacter sp. Leaf132]
MLTAKKYITGTAVFDKIIATITFSSAPSDLVVSIPPLKYDKKNWFSFEMDDHSSSIPFALSVLANKFYTDGCGNNKPYTMAASVNGAQEMTGEEYDFSNEVGDRLRAVIAANGDLSDHGYYHDPVGFGANMTALQSTIAMQDFIQRKFNGFQTRSKIVPTNYAGHAQAAFDQGYLYSTSQSQSDGFTAEWQYAPPGNNAVVGPFAALRRDFTDQWANDFNFIKGSITNLVAATDKFYRIGSHTIDNQAAFQSFFDFVQSSSNDQLWVTTTREVFEYKEVSALPIIQSLVGNTLNIEVDLSTLSAKNMWKDISFLLNTTANIQSVTTNANSFSFNNSSKLLNLFKKTS